MHSPTAEVLSHATNTAVIQLKERRFPAVAIQGDSLHILEGLVREVTRLIDKGDLDEARDVTIELTEILSGYSSAYEATLKKHGIELPYAK